MDGSRVSTRQRCGRQNSIFAQCLLEGRAVGRGQMLRGSWEPCQQMGPRGSLSKPTNPSQADPHAGPEPIILP